MFKIKVEFILYFLYFLISFSVLFNLFSRGYILTLDMVFTDKNIYPIDLRNSKKAPSSLLIFKLTFFLIKFLPNWIIQKMLIFLVFLLSSFFTYKISPAKNKMGKFFSGLIYTINPFLYIRVLAGHLPLLLAYSFLPILLGLLITFFENGNIRQIIKIALLLTLISVSVHYVPILLFLVFLFFLFNFIIRRNWFMTKKLLYLIAIYLLLNIFWISMMVYPNYLTKMDSWINSEHLKLFSSIPSFNFNTLFNLASMHGFWRQGYDYAKFHIPSWPVLYGIILFLSVHGFLILNRDPKYKIYARALAIISVGALILATGITHPLFSKIFKFLFDYFPFFKGYREPHKFVALLCLAYAFFGGVGLGDFVEQFKNSKKLRAKILIGIFIAISLATPFIYSYTMFFGFHGQLESVDYPETWYETDDYLNKDKDDFNILFLPWHQYMTFRFNPKQRIANPADRFFTKPVIQGDNMEAGDIYSQSLNPLSKYIEFLLFNNKKYDNFGELVKPLNIKYIILAKEVDWQRYQFLHNQTDLELVIENEDLLVFKNTHKTSPVYGTDETLTKDDWNQFLNNYTFDLEPLEVEKKSPIKYILQENPTKQYLVFTEKFSDGWRYGDQKPELYLGAINHFEASEENTIYYHRFRYYLIGYLISGTTFLILIGYLIYDWKRDFFNRIQIKITVNTKVLRFYVFISNSIT